jgi:hypothetical protein
VKPVHSADIHCLGKIKTAMLPGPRQLLQERFAALTSDVESLFAEAREQTRREFAEQLNQSVRRLRLADDPEEVCATLADSAACFASGALLFRIVNGAARNPRLDVPLADAPALRAAADGNDPVVALATPAEVSPPLVDMLGHDATARAHIFPVPAHHGIGALVYTWGIVQGPAIELLAQVAGAVWAAMPEPKPEPEPVVQLVTIVPAPPASDPAPPATPKPVSTWNELPLGEQQIHLRAQRFARVHIAEIRLQHADEVKSGRARRNIYEALREPIDSAREVFRAQFFQCPSMVDYLDLELTRTLANEDPELLGHSYPGPLI